MKYSWDRVVLTTTEDETNAPTITFGNVVPNGSVTAAVGSLYICTLGGASTTLYVKESGSGNTGWVGK